MGRKNLIIWVKFHIIIIQYYCNLKTFKTFFNILSFAIIYNVTDHLFLMSPTGKFVNIYFIHAIKLSVCSFHFRCFYSWTILERNDSCASCHTGNLHYLFFFFAFSLLWWRDSSDNKTQVCSFIYNLKLLTQIKIYLHSMQMPSGSRLKLCVPHV